jgi:hypothetical protein
MVEECNDGIVEGKATECWKNGMVVEDWSGERLEG